ncbi:MAG TPA: M1 family aminopeptidase [Bryobacteraceae bacterium]|nr:M1 family aminopeptidase [Bryobacteraceae bacterium]
MGGRLSFGALLSILVLCPVSSGPAQTSPAQTTAATSHTASDLAQQVLSATLNPAECYHVRDIEIHQQDVTFYLTEGYLIFGTPVNGAPISAVFSTDVEGGDGEVVLLPPDRAERQTLASFTQSPNLDEHFSNAVLFFTDGGARALAERIQKDPTAEKSKEMGLLMADKWNVTVTNLTTNFETRIVLDLMTKGPSGAGFFDATVRGRKLGDFDVVHDARATEQIGAGKVEFRNGVGIWETWTRFVARDRRGRPEFQPEEEILSYNIDASMDASLSMRCVTRLRIRARPDSRDVIPLELDGAMRVKSAKVDGIPAEFYQHDSLRGGLVQNSGNQLFLIVPPHPLEPGSEHEIEVVHEGKVVVQTGDGIYSVRARGTWYPGRGSQFATYDVTFHYPENLNLISAGAIREDQTHGGIRTTHRVPEGKLRLLGLNLGQYTRRESVKNGITLDVSANRELEDALRPPSVAPIFAPTSQPSSHSIRVPAIVAADPPPPDPAERLDAIASGARAAIEYFRTRFGDPPLKHIEISPVTGRFGQGFAGMIYLPTRLYLDPSIMRVRAGTLAPDEGFMGELLRAHETAHQWWGNIVTTDSYHHEWLMESLANYSALMFMESRMGPHAIERALEYYHDQLLLKGLDGTTAEARGPVVEGRRLESADAPSAADAVLYGKGTWIIHMLRRRMGDTAFVKMLAEARRRYEWKTITTEDFRELCAEFLPPGSADPKLVDFFDQWVYDTGMPTLKLTYTVSGHRLNGTITQSDVPDDFTVLIPVEIRVGNGKPIVKQVRTENGAVKFTVNVAGPGAKATLDPGMSVLRR